MRILVFLVMIAAGLGSVFVYATLPGEQSRVVHRMIVRQLAPVADLVHDFRDFDFRNAIASFDTVIHDGYVAGRLKTCLQTDPSYGVNADATIEGFVSLRDHRTVAGIISCFVSDTSPTLCEARHQAPLLAMVDLYFRARHNALSNPRRAAFLAEEADGEPDRFAATWDGPEDRSILLRLTDLARDGYLSLEDFGWLPRAEIRQALDGIAVTHAPCTPAVSGRRPI